MAKKRNIPQKLLPWVEARRRHRLTHAQIQMARELGLNPKKFGGIANHGQETWKAPLPQYIENLYMKRFGRPAPLNIRSIEQIASDERKRKEERRQRKAQTKKSDDSHDRIPPS